MSAILATTFPFFALIFCGWAAARRGWLSLAAIPGLNGFVLFFALPCMLYRFGARTPLAQLLDPRVAAVWLACSLAMVALVTAASRRAGTPWRDAAMGALVAAFPNTGFMGVPLLLALLGAAAAGPVIQTLAIDMVATTSLCVGLSQLGAPGAGGPGGAWAAVRRALAGMAANPMPWAIVAGVLASWSGFALPAPIDRTVALLGDAAAPVALFTIGAVLARAQMDRAQHLPWRGYVPLALAKLLLHPLLVLGACALARALGVGPGETATRALVLVAALPAASNVSLLAERLGAHNGRIARVILVSTVLAFGSFSAAVALLTGG